jgi:hypothetical protein
MLVRGQEGLDAITSRICPLIRATYLRQALWQDFILQFCGFVPACSFQITASMLSLISALCLVETASAQITTSFPYYKTAWGSDKVGFYGSVISVKDSHTAIRLEFDNGTSSDTPGYFYPDDQQFTIGPNMFETRVRLGSESFADNGTDKMDVVDHCDIPESPADAAPNCTASAGPWIARGWQCDSTATSSTSYSTYTNTFSGRLSYSAGVETITRTFIFGPWTKGFPTWCTISDFVPSSGLQWPVSAKREDIGTFQLVITAGQEKLSATPAVSASVSSATVTGAGAGSSGAAVPMKTVAPVIAGLGAAVAIFL